MGKVKIQVAEVVVILASATIRGVEEMRALLIFPPGWMQFGPYLSLPLLKGYLKQKGIKIEIMDLNIEFYDWVLSPETLRELSPRLRKREKNSSLSEIEYAKVCKGLLTVDHSIANIDRAKSVIKNSELYVDHSKREWAKKVIGESLNLIESSYDRFRLNLNQIYFGNCGLVPEKVLSFLDSDQNIVKFFYEQKVRSLLKKGYDFVGFSLPAWEQLVPSLTIAKNIKRDFGDQVHICMGGNYITRLVGTWKGELHPFATLVDSFSLFEGEESLYKLLDNLQNNRSLDDTPNLVYRAGDKLIHTPAKSIDIDTIPTPDFDGLPLGKYFSPETILPLYTSRSCPYQCAFCTIPYASSKFRARDPQKVVDDLENLKRKYNVRMFTFVDETLIIPSLNKITREIVNRKLDVNWYGETRFDRRIDRQLARQMFESGCRKLQFGLESYNQRVLDLMKKGTKVKYILPNIKSCLSEGIAVHLFTFLGFPGETEEEAKNTCEFSKYVIRLSEEEYGNPYSTVGMGAFGLEVYSDVYYHPDRYGVTFKDDIRHLTGDEIFEIKYTVKSGLSQEEAEDLVNQFHNKAILREVHERAGRIRWTTLAEKETNEEEAFLLYCLANQAKTESRPIPTEPPEHPGYLLPGTYRRSANLSPNVVVREFLRDFLRSGEQPGPVISFYDKARDLVVNLPVEEGATISAWLDENTFPEKLSDKYRGICNRLLRSGLIQISGEGMVKSLLDLSREKEDVFLIANPDFQFFRRDNGQFVLFNEVTQEILTVNTIVAFFFSLLRGMPQMLGDMLKLNQPGMNKGSIVSLLQELAALSAVIVLPVSTHYEERVIHAGF